MDNDKFVIFAAAIAIVALLASAGAIVMAAMSDFDDGEEDVYRIYVGFGDMSEEEVTPIDDAIKNQITGKFRLGYTAYEASGAAIANGSVAVDKITMVYMVTFTNDDTVDDIVDWIQDTYGLTILVEEYAAEDLTLYLS
ncbi:MAG: hypothetical protein E7Z66_05490 [Thermoplasmata archaeon]|nr:hypothetical protein [Thermoplasmata archaeon]